MQVLETSFNNTDGVYEVVGAMGKGGGGHQPTEANDTLSSKQTLRILLAIGEGKMSDTVPTVYLNRVLYTQYPGVTIDYRPGTVDQTVIPGFSAVEAPLTVLTAPHLVVHSNPSASPFIGSIDPSYDAVRVTLSLTQLRQITDQGDRLEYSVAYRIGVCPNIDASSPAYTWTNYTKTGKCTNPYSWDIRVPKPTSGLITGHNWGVSVERLTADDVTVGDKYTSPFYVTQVTQIVDSVHTYPNTALLGLTIRDAAQFNGQVPSISIVPYGMEMLMPDTYDPVHRTYTGTWLGAFKTVAEWTDNLAWAIYYSLVHPRWGLGISPTDVDSGSFYLFSQHCDESVPDGSGISGHTEPRYRIDAQFIDTQNTPVYLANLLALGNAQLGANETGQIAIIWDGADQQIKHIESNATVELGKFVYSSNSTEDRTSQVTATFSNRLLQGDTDTAVATDDALVARYGIQTVDLMLVGCTRQSQATRKCKWAIWANAVDTQIVTFKKHFAGMLYQKGDLVSIMDSENAVDMLHAMVKSTDFATNYHIHLDRTIHLNTSSYKILFIDVNGNYQTATILESNGDFSVVSSLTDLSVMLGTTLLFEEQGSTATRKPTTWKVSKVTKNGDSYDISAVVHSEAKYSYIGGIATITPPNPTSVYVNFDKLTVPAPTDIAVSEQFSSIGVIHTSYLEVSWLWDEAFTQGFHANYTVSYSRFGETATRLTGLPVKSFNIENPIPGTYTINVWAINPFSGLASPALTTTYNYRLAPATSSLDAPVNLYVANTTGGTFQDKNLNLTWQNPTSNKVATKLDRLKDYIIEIRDLALPHNVRQTFIVPPDTSGDGSFQFTFSDNVATFGTATRSFLVYCYCRDLVGDISNPATLSVNNPVPSHSNFSFSLLAGVNTVLIHITQTTPEPDIIGYQVKLDGTSIVYDGPDTYPVIAISPGTTHTFAVAAFDSFDKTSLDFSSTASIASLSNASTQWSLEGISFTASASTHVINWTGGTIYANGSPTSINLNNGIWTGSRLYIYYPGTGNELLTTTNIATAVGAGTYPVATYDGGDITTVKGGDGNAFISGSEILAGSVGASQLYAGTLITHQAQLDTAVVSEAAIASAVINSAAIKNVIKSANYSTTLHTGFALETGNSGATPSFKMYAGEFTLYDTAGTVIFSAANKFDGAYIKNLTVDTGQIKDLAVQTLKIQDNAVIIPNSSFVSSDISTSVAPATWTTLLSMPITNDGNPITWLIQANILISGVFNSLTRYRVLFDTSSTIIQPSTIVEQATLVTSGSYIALKPVIKYFDNVSGVHNIRFQIYQDDSSFPSTHTYTVKANSSMIVTGAKK